MSPDGGKQAGDKKTVEPETRDRYPHFLAIPSRWHDNDAYGHVNNVIYYAYFDTVVNRYLIDGGVLNIAESPVIGLAIESHCTFMKSITYPEGVDAGLRVGRLGNSSVRYEIGLFREGDPEPAATGYFVHVYVDRETRKPVPVPDDMRALLEKIMR